MDDDLIDESDMSIGRQSLLPGTGFFYPDSLDEQRADQRAEAALAGAEAVVVADPDADGLACTALVRAAHGPVDEDGPDPVAALRRTVAAEGDGETTETDPAAADPEHTGAGATDRSAASDAEDGDDEDPAASIRERSRVGLVPSGPTDVAEALARVAEFAPDGVAVYVCDLCPDEFETVAEQLRAVVDRAGTVRWFDHHQWESSVAEAVRAAGVDLVVGESDEECSADVALRSIEYDFPERLRALAAVTRDHDLWLREDERSDDLADLAYWLDAELYVELVRRHGPDLPEPARTYLAERRERKRALIDRAADRAQFRTVGPWTVGVTYGRCSQNEVAERLREAGADAAVVVKPSGAASIRGSESFERCHEVARRVNGGGHPGAAGCKPDVYDDMLDYAHHWTTRGAVARQAILDAFEAIAPETQSEA